MKTIAPITILILILILLLTSYSSLAQDGQKFTPSDSGVHSSRRSGGGGTAIDGHDVLLTQVRKQFQLMTGLEMPAGIGRETVLAGNGVNFDSKFIQRPRSMFAKSIPIS